MIDICCIGHITHDRVITPHSDVHMPGGTSFYFTHGISHLLQGNVSYKLITSLAEEDMQAVRDIEALGISTEVIPSKHTVYFENIYGEDVNNRRQRVLAKADPFTVESLQGVEARYIVLGTLLADDFSLDVIRHLSARGTLVVDAQGYLREVRDQKVYPVDWPDKLEALKYVDILKVNEHEVSVLTGEKDLYEGARRLAEWGVREVLLTLGSFGSIIYADGKFYDIPAYEPVELVDATGCGDTYVMGYLFQRCQGASVSAAAHFAAAVSTLKLEHAGPFCGTFEEVVSRIPEDQRD
ncbi:MAG: ribokinase [Bacteroidaceae bacterium]|nr:ribokinase [Bacteroidaceae bacterium]MBR3546477.1 ribokinase [Bacteroidaceae bacterium]